MTSIYQKSEANSQPPAATRVSFASSNCPYGVPINAELSGYEIDAFDPNYPAPDSVWRLLLASSPFTNFQGKTNFTQNTSLYCAHSGAFVFATFREVAEANR